MAIKTRETTADGVTNNNAPLTNAELDNNFIELQQNKQAVLSEGSFADGDKTKLDGIESGADVTDTANVTAAGALMDSEVTNLAQVKAFDSTDYATAAQGALADTAIQPADVNEIVAPTRHSIRPSLLLDFANSKTLDPRITFTRSSTATYYDGKTHAKAEENLLTLSEDFDNWNKGNVTVTSNATTAPDGTTTADALYSTATGGEHYVYTSGVGSKYCVFSVYAKEGSADSVMLNGSASADYAVFNLSTGTVASTASNIIDSGIEDVGNGWYRCWIYSLHSTSTNRVHLADSSYGTPYSFTGTGAEYIYIWGAQLEQRSSVTAYTPTTSQPITNYIPVLQTAASGTARFDHDPVTGESKGLLIEEQRTNLFQDSSLSTVSTQSGVIPRADAPVPIAPDGTASGWNLIETTGSTYHGTGWQTSGYSIGTKYAISMYVKKSESAAQNRQIRLYGREDLLPIYVQFDFSDNSVSGSGSDYGADHVGNGWYRIWATGTAIGTVAGGAELYLYLYDSSGSQPYTGIDGHSSAYVWGIQVEVGAFPTSYIPTSGSQVTRSADSASMTGTNFSDWYRQDEGTVYIDAAPNAPSYALVISDGTTYNTLVAGRYSTTGTAAVSTVNLVTQANIGTTSSSGKIAFAYNVDDFSVSVNGNAVATDSSGLVPNVNQINFGALATGAVNINGTIKKATYYPTRLTNAELVALTED